MLVIRWPYISKVMVALAWPISLYLTIGGTPLFNITLVAVSQVKKKECRYAGLLDQSLEVSP
jgi:hypothetical protein